MPEYMFSLPDASPMCAQIKNRRERANNTKQERNPGSQCQEGLPSLLLSDSSLPYYFYVQDNVAYSCYISFVFHPTDLRSPSFRQTVNNGD